MCCLVFLTGCGTMKTTWRDTRKLYREYINTDPTIDLSDEGIGDKGLQRLAALFMLLLIGLTFTLCYFLGRLLERFLPRLYGLATGSREWRNKS